MKKTFLAFVAFVLILSANAQAKTWDSTYRPGSYDLRTEIFRSYPNAPGDIIFLGNSIVAGVDWMELLGMPNARNRGISGDITYGVLERLDEVTEGKPAKIFVLIGINDISRNIPDSLILQNYLKIIHRIKQESPGTKIYFQTLMPVNNEFTQFKNHYNKDEHILFINTQLKKIAKDEKITLIDLYPHFLNADNKLKKEYTKDGLHPNADGYKVWAKVLKDGGYLKN